MDEAGARAWLAAECNVPRETFDRLEAFVALLRDENDRQNLVSAASLDHVWTRHIVDSAQLLKLAGEGEWLDLGTGAGFPGLIVSALRDGPVTMVEERKRRVEFLERAAEVLGITDRATILCGRVDRRADIEDERERIVLLAAAKLGREYGGERGSAYAFVPCIR